MAFILFILVLCGCAGGCQPSQSMIPEVSGRYEGLGLPSLTMTKSGKPGDPINVALVGEPEALVSALVEIGWQPADSITFKSAAKIAKDVVLKKSDPNAPVSNLYLWGRVQDIAFEQEVNGSPRQRHHVRFWLSDIVVDGRPVWVGAATYDRGIYLRKFSHHIAADIDAERAYLLDALTRARLITNPCAVPGIGKTDQGRNGEGDPYFTDGQIHVARLIPLQAPGDL